MIEGPEHRVVPRRRRVLTRSGDPGLEELEELAHPLRCRRRQRRRRIITHVTGGVNSSTGQTSRTPNAASISAAFLACKNRWNILNVCA
jgi:hypothetical protein